MCRGKGTPRRKIKKVHKSAGTDDKKLQTALKKLNVQPIQAIEEVNMFKSDGNVIHFSAPKGTSIQVLCDIGVMVSGGRRRQRTSASRPPDSSQLLRPPTNISQFTHQYPPTPSPSTETVRTRS
jgi:hypothetical protein